MNKLFNFVELACYIKVSVDYLTSVGTHKGVEVLDFLKAIKI